MAIIVHGVGDHSSGHILQKAMEGLSIFGANKVRFEEAKILDLPELAADEEAVAGLEIEDGEQTHFLIPVVWSRLRPRAAKEADFAQAYPAGASRVFDRLLQPIFYLFPAFINAIRCIPKASGVSRRLLVSIIALAYAIAVPTFLMCVFFFVSYLTTLRVSLDRIHHVWWRVGILLIICWLLDWILGKILMVFDFVGDVVGYVGNSNHRRKAEERLLRILRAISSAAPSAQILVVGHSLGSVLVTHSVLQLGGGQNLCRRLRILTMGSPLKLMSWFFPSQIYRSEQLLDEFERRDLVFSWANMWRDADIIGRALKVPSGKRFAERSLGNGTHTDYWADARSWRAVVDYLRAGTYASLQTLTTDWMNMAVSADEKREIFNTRWEQIRLSFLFPIVLILAFYLGRSFHVPEWVATLDLGKRALVYSLVGVVWIPVVIWYVWSTQSLEGAGMTEREKLARYRLNLFIGGMCLKVAFAISLMAGLSFLLWKSFVA